MTNKPAKKVCQDAKKWLERNTLVYMSRYRGQHGEYWQDLKNEPIPTFISYKILLDKLLDRFIVRTRISSSEKSDGIKSFLYKKEHGIFCAISPGNIEKKERYTPIVIFEGETDTTQQELATTFSLDDTESKNFRGIDIRDVILANGASYYQYPRDKKRDITCDEQLRPVFNDYSRYKDMAKKGMSEGDKSIFCLRHVRPGTVAEEFDA